MPKQTFFNLPPDKRQKIIDTALDEFALYDYKTASLSRIVENAGIAKGSMYQYFENKKDLYFYLIDLVANDKLTYISQAVKPFSDDFFVIYTHMIMIAAQYDLSHIRYSQLMFNAGRESYNDELGDMAENIKMKSQTYIKDFVAEAQKKGQLRTDVDVDLIAFVISNLSITMSEYIKEKYDFSYAAIIENGKGSLPITDEQLKYEIEQLTEIFKHGFLPRDVE